MKQMKVMLVIRQLIVGGAESQTFNLATRMDRQRFAMSVCSLQPGGYFGPRLKECGIPLHYALKKWKYDVTIIPRLVWLFRKESPDIVHCVMWTASVWAGIAAKLAGVPALIFSTRSTGIWKSWTHRMAGPPVFSMADLILANSEGVKQYMVKKEGVRKELVKVVRNGLDLNEFDSKGKISEDHKNKLKRELGIKEGEKVIGIVANISLQKDYPTFIKAAEEVSKKNRNIRFLAIGDGPLRKEMESMAGSMGIGEKIVFAGLREDVPALLKIMDLFVLTSLREGLSNALIEATASSLPVIATDVGGNPEVIRNGLNGYLFPVGDHMKLSGLILDLISDPDKSLELGRKGRALTEENFSMKKFLEDMAQIYEEIARRKGFA